MGLGESALILLGIGIVSQKFGAGLGLEQLGTGIKTLAAAPLGGVGLGLGEFSGGLRSFAETLGDVGRGFGTLFESIPTFPAIPGTGLPGPASPGQGLPPPPPPSNGGWGGGGSGVRTLELKSGGGSTDLLAGGGGSTPPPMWGGPYIPSPAPPPGTPTPPPMDLSTRPITMRDDRLRNVVML